MFTSWDISGRFSLESGFEHPKPTKTIQNLSSLNLLKISWHRFVLQFCLKYIEASTTAYSSVRIPQHCDSEFYFLLWNSLGNDNVNFRSLGRQITSFQYRHFVWCLPQLWVISYPVWPRHVAWCRGARPRMSLWLTSAPFCSRNSQAIREPYERERYQIRVLLLSFTTYLRMPLSCYKFTVNHGFFGLIAWSTFYKKINI